MSLLVSLLPLGKASPSLGRPWVPQALGCRLSPACPGSPWPWPCPTPQLGLPAQEQGEQSLGLRVGEGPPGTARGCG